MKCWILIFLVPIISCRKLTDELFAEEPVEPTEAPPTALPTTEEPIPEGIRYEPVGCFRDRSPSRAMEFLMSYRKTIDWNNLQKTVDKCADEAMNRRHLYFAVQFWGECWGGEEADLTYNRYGPNPNGCYKNLVGRAWNNMVYKFVLPGIDE